MLAVGGVESEQGIAVEVVAGPALAAIGWRGIAGRPENLVGLGIVGAGVPGGSAANFPGVAFPGIVTGFAGAGHGVEAPFALAGSRVVSVDEDAYAVFAAGDGRDDQGLHG